MKNHLAIIAISILLTGCSYFESGTWEDDPKNWDRIYFEPKPTYVKIIHSRYWKSAHWSLEYVYYMQADSSEQLLQWLLKENNKITLQNNEDKIKGSLGGKPDWFAPKSLDQYEIWTSDQPYGYYFILLKDKDTGQLFWHDIHL